jgi:hypothetical protein
MAERKSAKKGTRQSAKRTIGKTSKGFPDEERAAMSLTTYYLSAWTVAVTSEKNRTSRQRGKPVDSIENHPGSVSPGARRRSGSVRETEMVRWYRERHAPDRALIWEYQLVSPSTDRTGRWIDAVILADEEGDETWVTEPVEGKPVIVVQAKVRRLSMGLLGQTYFSMRLTEDLCGAEAMEAVALCRKTDSALEEIACQTDSRLRVCSPPATD